MKLVVFLFVLAASVAVALGREGFCENIRLPDRRQCYKQGYICTDCNTLVHCTHLGDGTFREEPVASCNVNGQRCFDNGTLAQCVSDKPCNFATFTCEDSGLYPDPIDCKTYHYCQCSGATPISSTCNEGYAFDSTTRTCSLKITNGICPGLPVPLCRESRQTGAVGSNIFYLCLEKNKRLVSTMHHCSNGANFDEATLSCK